MALDARIIEAVRTTVSEQGQPEALANRLVAWLEGLTEQNESLEDVQRKWMHVELLYEATAVGELEED